MKTDPISYSGFTQRLFAYNLDITAMLVVFFPLSLWLANDWLFYTSCFVIICIYHATFESSDWQGTLGKRYGKMKVVDYNSGHSISFGRALIRILAKFLSLAPCFAGFFMIYFRRDRRGLHDLIAGTCVVRVAPKETKEANSKGNKM